MSILLSRNHVAGDHARRSPNPVSAGSFAPKGYPRKVSESRGEGEENEWWATREPEPPIRYTRRVFPEAKARDVHFSEPVEEGDRAAVEWWATLVSPDDEEQTLAGCSVLRFGGDGLVAESRDYWHLEPGRRDPPPGWGR